MTGIWRLIKANDKRNDPGGIGYTSAKAVWRPALKSYWGKNKLDIALQENGFKMRENYHIRDDAGGYAWDFWRLWEELCNNERYINMAHNRGYLHGSLPRNTPTFDRTTTRAAAEEVFRQLEKEWVEEA